MKRRVWATLIFAEYSISPTENNSFTKSIIINEADVQRNRHHVTFKDHRSDLIMIIYLLS